MDFIKKNHKAVDATAPATKGKAPDRTLWHALYFPEERKVRISFYLGDQPIQNQPGKTRIARSEYLDFVLQSAKSDKENGKVDSK